MRVAASRDDVVDHTSTHVGEPEVSPGVPEGQLFVVQAHQVEDGGVQITNVSTIFHRPHSKFVSGSVAVARLDTSAGHPDGEPEMVVVPAGLVGRDVGGRGATELTSPQYECLVQQPASLEVGEQGGYCTVTFECLGTVVVDVGVVVPGDVGSECQLDDADSPLGQAASDQGAFRKAAVFATTGNTLGGFGADSVQVVGGLGFPADVEGLGCGKLHSKRQFQ